MPPKNPQKQAGKKRRKEPPPEPESDDSTSGTEAEAGEAETHCDGDAEEDNIRLSRRVVRDEDLQSSETVQAKNKMVRRSRSPLGSLHASTAPRSLNTKSTGA
mgnify:CR=1 FL=1